jgi:hypothetical protein
MVDNLCLVIYYTNNCTNSSQIDLWDFTHRIPCSDMKLIGVVKELVHMFWHKIPMPSSNQKYLLKLRRGSRDHEPHIKHFLEMT